MATRAETLARLRQQPDVPVLVIGGGINGVGVFRDLALQGVDVLLIDKADICAGASAASTRIIHGGLRYLENGEFRLVRESVNERNRLLLNAPHYVRPLATTIPVFNWFSGLGPAIRRFFGLKTPPANRGALLVRAGLWLYDSYTRRQRLMPRHRFTPRGKAMNERPGLNPYIIGTATYYDARIAYPERLCLELVLDAEAANPNARALNYARIDTASGETVTLRDEVTGETISIRPQIVVNATGAWIDFTNEALQRKTAFIGGTKGSHLVIDHPELWTATRGEMLYYENVDGRICIFYPFYDKVIIGSTDLPVDDPENAVCDDDETEYMLHATRQVFPDIDLNASHIVFRFCGVRPLPRSDANTPGQISRDHSFPVLPPGSGLDFPIYNLIGGKWTTFRAFAEQVSAQIMGDLGRTRHVETENIPIGGGKDYPRTDAERTKWLAQVAAQTGVPNERLTVLLDRYGTRAADIARFIAAGHDAPLDSHAGYSRREIEFIARYERVVHLDDVLLRRTLMGILGEVSAPLVEEIAGILAPVLGWNDVQTREEILQVGWHFTRVHSVQLSE